MKNLLYLLSIAFLFSCSKTDLESIYETIYVANKGADMPVYLFGNQTSKKVILVIHGGPGGNGLVYRTGRWKDNLEQNYLMAYWDQRGQGMSEGNYSNDELTVDKMAEDLYAVVKTLKFKLGNDTKIILLGHSWGGMLGTAYMTNLKYQKEVAGWIESNGAHDLPLLNKEAVKMFISISKEQISLDNHSEEWSSIKEWAEKIDILNITNDDSGQINEKAFEVEDYLLQDGILNYAENGTWSDFKISFFSPMNPLTSFISGNYTNSALNDEVESTSLTSQLSKITKPCLFLYSKYDFVVPAALGIEAYAKVSSRQKKLVIFESSGHSPMSNEASKFTEEVEGFVENL
jgi:pimeloyl-ACP methyl ester carboxylesterase